MCPWWVLQASITVATVTVGRKIFMVWRSAGYIRPVWVFLLHSFKLPGILALCSKIRPKSPFPDFADTDNTLPNGVLAKKTLIQGTWPH